MTVTIAGLRGANLTVRTAAEIKAWMGRLDIRQAELARRLGENQEWLSTRLRGRTPLDLNDLERIADILGVPVGVLIPAKEPSAWKVQVPDRPVDNRPSGVPRGSSRQHNRPPGRPRTVSDAAEVIRPQRTARRPTIPPLPAVA